MAGQSSPHGYKLDPASGFTILLPFVHIPSDHPPDDVQRQARDIVHTDRAGNPVGVWRHESVRRWTLDFQKLTLAEVGTLQTLYDLKFFYYIPDVADAEPAQYRVFWEAPTRFRPTLYQRGSFYSLSGVELVEVT